MSSVYRTTVINWVGNLEEVWESESLSLAAFIGATFSVTDDEVKIDEVLKDACGDYVVLKNVLEYVKKDD